MDANKDADADASTDKAVRGVVTSAKKNMPRNDLEASTTQLRCATPDCLGINVMTLDARLAKVANAEEFGRREPDSQKLAKSNSIMTSFRVDSWSLWEVIDRVESGQNCVQIRRPGACRTRAEIAAIQCRIGVESMWSQCLELVSE